MEGIFTLTESFSVTPPLRIRYVSMLLVSIHCLFRHTGILSLGKERMVQWTTPFMIGITKMILNSYIPPPSSGYSIPFPNQPKKFRKAEDGCVDICFYDWLYFGLHLLNHISALSTVKRYKFSQSTLILKQTTHNFSKSPSKSCSGYTSGR